MSRTGVLLLVMGTLVSWPVHAQELSLEAVLNEYYEALGGLEMLKSVNSMKITGRVLMGQGMESPFTRWSKRPDMVRLEFMVQGVTGIQAYDGEAAWMLMPFMGQTDPELMPLDMAREMEEEADFDGPLVDYAEKGHQVELLGKEEVEGTETYKLKVTLKNGDVSYFYLDSEYYLPIKTEGKRTFAGNEFQITTILGDYKEVGGLMMAHSIQVTGRGPGLQTLIFAQIELNVEIDDAQFKMPEPTETETKKPSR